MLCDEMLSFRRAYRLLHDSSPKPPAAKERAFARAGRGLYEPRRLFHQPQGYFSLLFCTPSTAGAAGISGDTPLPRRRCEADMNYCALSSEARRRADSSAPAEERCPAPSPVFRHTMLLRAAPTLYRARFFTG